MLNLVMRIVIQIQSSIDRFLKMTLIGHRNRIKSSSNLPNSDIMSEFYDETIKIWNIAT
jgi:WD40 repeat protein